MRDAHEIRFAAPRPRSGFPALDLGEGGGGDWPLDYRSPLPVIEAKPVSRELRAALDAWNQGSGLIDPTRTATDPTIVEALKRSYEPGGPWHGEFDWHGFMTGKGLFDEQAPPTNAPIEGALRGPRGSEPLTARELSPDDSLAGFLKSFDPRQGEGIANLAGLMGGPRVKGEYGPMGFGHPEKEMPSIVPGFTLKRLKDREYMVDDNGEPMQFFGKRAAMRSPMGRAKREATKPWDRQGPSVAYNWVKDDTGEVVGSIEMTLSPSETYVNWLGIRKPYRKTPLSLDVARIMEGAGKAVEATITNPQWGRAMGKLGKVNPLYRHLARYDTSTFPNMTRDYVSPFDRPQETGGFGAYDEPQALPPIGGRRFGSNYSYAGTAVDDPNAAMLTSALERRLDSDGHGRLVDELYDANVTSVADRARVYLARMPSLGYTPRQVSAYRGRMTRLGLNVEPSLANAHRELTRRLREDGWTDELRAIRNQTTTRERRVALMLQFMREYGYHPFTIEMFKSHLPRDARLPEVSVSELVHTPEPPRTSGDWADAARRIADRLFDDDYESEVAHINQRWPLGGGRTIQQTEEALRGRVRDYLEFMNGRGGYDIDTISELARLAPEPPRTLGERPLTTAEDTRASNRGSAMEVVASDLARRLQRDFPDEVLQIQRNDPFATGTRIRRYLDLMRGSERFRDDEIRDVEARLPQMFPPGGEE